MQQAFRLAFRSRRKFLGQQVWLHKGVRTLIVVAPGLAVFSMTGNQLAVTFAFAALCLSVPYGDQVSARLICFVWHRWQPFSWWLLWLQRHPMLYVLVIALVGAALVLISRSAILPPRITTWFLIYVLYQSNELRSTGFQAAIFAALLVAPASAWTYVACFLVLATPRRTRIRQSRERRTNERAVARPLCSHVDRHCCCRGIRLSSLSRQLGNTGLRTPSFGRAVASR